MYVPGNGGMGMGRKQTLDMLGIKSIAFLMCALYQGSVKLCGGNKSSSIGKLGGAEGEVVLLKLANPIWHMVAIWVLSHGCAMVLKVYFKVMRARWRQQC